MPTKPRTIREELNADIGGLLASQLFALMVTVSALCAVAYIGFCALVAAEVAVEAVVGDFIREGLK